MRGRRAFSAPVVSPTTGLDEETTRMFNGLGYGEQDLVAIAAHPKAAVLLQHSVYRKDVTIIHAAPPAMRLVGRTPAVSALLA